MADQTSDFVTMPRRPRGSRLEYRFYFAVIVAAALPFAALFWLKDLALLNDRALKSGILDRAKREAGHITPWIFSQ